MKIKKYQGKSETEAMALVKEELGSDALIVSVKHIKPRGIFRFFRKQFIEVTAAIDDRNVIGDKELPHIHLKADDVIKNKESLVGSKSNAKGDELDEFKQFIEKFSSKQKERQQQQYETVKRIHESIDQSKEEYPSEKDLSKEDLSKEVDPQKKRLLDRDIHIQEENVEESSILKLIYEQLIDNEVDEPCVNELMSGLVEYVHENDPNIDDVVAIVYKRIIKAMSEPAIILPEGKGKTVFFIGPTGVGKTTTIAKIASLHTLNYNRQVALITADTYRIAAVEQLRTYANILSIPIRVVYTKEEMLEAVELYKDKDLILIDTAGRSHHNEEHQAELKELLQSIEQKEVFLTVSVATKYKDLVKIVKTYKEICDFNIVFTKLDETLCLGNILNIKMVTKSKLSYVTFGQNVPDDISEIDPHRIAKNLLGGDNDGSSE